MPDESPENFAQVPASDAASTLMADSPGTVMPPQAPQEVAVPVSAPTATPPPPDKKFFGMIPEAFDALVGEWGWPRYRAQQVRQWVYEKTVGDPRGMPNLSRLDRGRLAAAVAFARATVASQQTSED